MIILNLCPLEHCLSYNPDHEWMCSMRLIFQKVPQVILLIFIIVFFSVKCGGVFPDGNYKIYLHLYFSDSDITKLWFLWHTTFSKLFFEKKPCACLPSLKSSRDLQNINCSNIFASWKGGLQKFLLLCHSATKYLK